MKTLDQWLDLYQVSHQNPTNKHIHHVCVPAIEWSLLAMLWPLGQGVLNAAVVVTIAALIFYARLGMKPLILMGVQALVMLAVIVGLERAGVPLMATGAVVFAVAWVGQFIGHHIEGRKPSFFQDLQFLLIGPLWVWRGRLSK